METIIYVIVTIVVLLVVFRYCLDKCKSHEIYKLLDSYGAIQILDNQGLIAILYSDRTIDWQRSTSLFKMIKIKEISDHFENEYQVLEDEANSKIIKDWRDK